MKEIRWGRVLRLGVVALFGMIVTVDVFLAWVYVSALIEPGCHRGSPDPAFPSPQVEDLTTQDGLSLQVWYYPSQNGAAVISLGGMGGSLGQNIPPVGVLIENGYGVLQIDSRACANPPSAVTIGAKEVYDAEAGLEFLLSRPEVDSDRIGVFGFSMGGVTAIRTAARNNEVAAVLAEGGYFNMGKDFVEPEVKKSLPRSVFLYTIAGVFWARTGVNPWEVSPIDDLPKISPRDVFLIYGENEIASGRGQEQYDAAQEPKVLWVVPEGAHGINHLVAPEEYRQRVLDFFDEALR